MDRKQSLYAVGIAGIASYFIWRDQIDSALGFSAEGETSDSGFLNKVVSRIRERFTPSELQQIAVERTGQTVDIIPQNRTEGFSDACSMAHDKSALYVNDWAMGPGVSDVKIEAKSPYNYDLAAEDFLQFNSLAPGQEQVSSGLMAMNQGYQPSATAACCRPVESFGLDLNKNINIPSQGNPEMSRIGLARLQGKTTHMAYSPNENDGYTNGSDTKSLAEWRSEGYIETVTDSSARFVPFNGSPTQFLRRV